MGFLVEGDTLYITDEFDETASFQRVATVVSKVPWGLVKKQFQ